MKAQAEQETIVDRLDRLADRHPDKLLYSFLNVRGEEIERHTYRSFQKRSMVIAANLLGTLGYKFGDRLLLAHPPGLEMIATFFACARAGIIPVPVAPVEGHGRRAALFRLSHIARNCGASGLLTSGGTAESLTLDESISRLAWTATDLLTDESLPIPSRHSDVLFLQYTSGSTSEPKGVIVTHANVLHNCTLVVDHETPITVSWLPQHHDMGLIGYYLYTCMTGGTLFGFSPTAFIQRPSLWFETITKQRATATSAPNFALEYCLRPGRLSKSAFSSIDLSSIRFFMAAAEPIRPEVYARFLDTFAPYGLDRQAFYVAYGLAENTLAVSSYGRKSLSLDMKAQVADLPDMTRGSSRISKSSHLMSCGRPLGDIRIEIVDPARRHPLCDGEIGEIWIAGKSKCAGYWSDPEATRRTFDARLATDQEGVSFLRTGDMGLMKDGELYVSGRLKEMMIIRGQNVFPNDIELVAERASEGLRKGCAVAFQIEDASGDGDICLVAELTSLRAEVDPRAVATAVQADLGVDIGLVLLVRPHEVPKTSSGKIMRLAAREKFLTSGFSELSRWQREHGSNAAGEKVAGPLESLKARYGLSGAESITLGEVGVDSLDIVVLLHEVRAMLEDGGANVLAKLVDVSVLQQIKVSDMFRLLQLFTTAPLVAIDEARRLVTELGVERRAHEELLMRTDACVDFAAYDASSAVSNEAPAAILVTGATGFLGPFLLKSLTEQTDAKIYALVRAKDEAQARQRISSAIRATGFGVSTLNAIEGRVIPICGDLEQPRLGLSQASWDALADSIDTIYHNGAVVNYLFDYKRMRRCNVVGTQQVLELAFAKRTKIFNHISTTFIFGWATKQVLRESDFNAERALLDFGYSQSKWVSERIVASAGDSGLPVRIFRPALISPSIAGEGNNFDIAIRLLAFMIRHGIGVNALNQVSFTPADVVAHNVVAISGQRNTIGGAFHVARDDYANMSDITGIITRLTGQQFTLFDLPQFVPEVVRRCTPEDLLFPLLDFLINSVDNISAMQFKRYDSSNYQRARAAAPMGKSDPSLEDTVAGILRFMDRKGIGPDTVKLQRNQPG